MLRSSVPALKFAMPALLKARVSRISFPPPLILSVPPNKTFVEPVPLHVPPDHVFDEPLKFTWSEPVNVPPDWLKPVGAMISQLLKFAVPFEMVRLPTLPTVPVKLAVPTLIVVLLPARS